MQGHDRSSLFKIRGEVKRVCSKLTFLTMESPQQAVIPMRSPGVAGASFWRLYRIDTAGEKTQRCPQRGWVKCRKIQEKCGFAATLHDSSVNPG
jgi:hypothetical protein